MWYTVSRDPWICSPELYLVLTVALIRFWTEYSLSSLIIYSTGWAQWQNKCFRWTKPWVQSPALKQEGRHKVLPKHTLKRQFKMLFSKASSLQNAPLDSVWSWLALSQRSHTWAGLPFFRAQQGFSPHDFCDHILFSHPSLPPGFLFGSHCPRGKTKPEHSHKTQEALYI